MRLIRLTTENNNCFFESVFNSDLTIKPFSKVALASFTTQLDNLSMIIDSQNNEISYSVDGASNVKTLTLPNGTYTSSTVQDFWIETTKIFNQSMEYDTNQINRQWGCGIVNGRADFKCLTGERVAPKTVTSSGLYVTRNLIRPSGAGDDGRMQRNQDLAPIGNDAFLYIKSPNNKGCSSLTATLLGDTGTTASGFVLGYTAQNPNVQATVINPTSYLYGIRYVDTAQPYKFIVNGVETVSVYSPFIGDTLELTAYGGTLYFLRYRNTGNTPPDVIHTVDYNHQTDLFPLCLFVGRNTKISNIVFTSDPFYNIVNTFGGDIVLHANPNILPIPTGKTPTQCFIQFNSPDLASILGYNKSRYPDAGFSLFAEPDFIADKAFSLRDFSESYIVELNNIKLNSMDSLSNGERSILYVIPQLSQIKEHVVFEAPQLIFLNINNTYDLNLREIKARVLKDDLSQFRCYGLSTIVLIIKDKDEI